MARFFITGNVWLLVALLLTLGSHVERTEPTCVSFFGVGAWFDPGTYNVLITLCIIAAVCCLTLAWKTCRPVA